MTDERMVRSYFTSENIQQHQARGGLKSKAPTLISRNTSWFVEIDEANLALSHSILMTHRYSLLPFGQPPMDGTHRFASQRGGQ